MKNGDLHTFKNKYSAYNGWTGIVHDYDQTDYSYSLLCHDENGEPHRWLIIPSKCSDVKPFWPVVKKPEYNLFKEIVGSEHFVLLLFFIIGVVLILVGLIKELCI